jgi:predicted nucleotidyltransferase
MGELSERRAKTDHRVEKLRKKIDTAERLLCGKACVYATGSFGRGEASEQSDLDLFIVGKKDQNGASRLGRLDEICVKADLIEATRTLGIPEFPGDGQYLDHFSVNEFTKTLGTPHDDVTNTFTARLLLLLESRPLLETAVYNEVTAKVVAAYWRDYEDHKNEFMPAFLANDILRLWRTFCVNYEARTQRQPDDKKAKGKLKNYKLKHSRMLTCYSALLYLLAVFKEQNTVHPVDALNMIELTPTKRLEWLLSQQSLSNAHQVVNSLIGQYEEFLSTTKSPESELITLFKDKDNSRAYLSKASEFGDLM